MTMMTAMKSVHTELPTTVPIASVTFVSEIELSDMNRATEGLKGLLRLIRAILGHEPKGSQLRVTGRFVDSSLEWGVYFTFCESVRSHVEYLANIGPVLPPPIIVKEEAYCGA